MTFVLDSDKAVTTNVPHTVTIEITVIRAVFFEVLRCHIDRHDGHASSPATVSRRYCTPHPRAHVPPGGLRPCAMMLGGTPMLKCGLSR